MIENNISEKQQKSPVASLKKNKKNIVSGVFISVTTIVVVSIILNASKEKNEAKENPPVLAAQTSTGRFDTKIGMIAESMLPTSTTKNNTPNSDQKKSSRQNSNSASEKLAARAAQQSLAIQMEAAQRRISSPSSAYKAKTNANDGVTNKTTQNANDPNSQWGNSINNQSVNTVSAKQQTLTDDKIFQGKMIPAVLDTAVNSDLPGLVRATINENVYGETGRKILLPKGTRLIGQYNSSIQTGQVRVFIMWTRAITPQQIDIQLGSPGTDSLGRAGMGGSVDNHFFEIFGASILLSVMAAGVADMDTNNSDTLYGNPYQYEVVESFSENSEKILEKTLDIKPTITIDQGEPIRVMVAQDLDFSTLAQTSGNIIYNPN